MRSPEFGLTTPKGLRRPAQGCVVQPRVAVCGYPGYDGLCSSNPNGVASVFRCRILVVRIDDATPSGLRSIGVIVPRVAVCGYPRVRRFMFLQSQRGCVVQPRVTVCGYPGYDGLCSSNPEGVASSSPGLPSAATLGRIVQVPATLKWLRPCFAVGFWSFVSATQPLQGCDQLA